VSEPAAPISGARRATILVTVAGLIVLADQLTKWWALEALDDGRVIDVLPTLEFQLTFNSGFSFGTGAGNGRLVGIAVCVLIVGLILYTRTITRTVSLVLAACILGGAIGNLIDRIFRADDGWLTGAVVDFIDVTWYAVFNVADMFVVCGAIALVAVEWRAESNARAAAD